VGGAYFGGKAYLKLLKGFRTPIKDPYIKFREGEVKFKKTDVGLTELRGVKVKGFETLGITRRGALLTPKTGKSPALIRQTTKLDLASLTLFFIGSKSYKMLSRKYETIETMFILPRYSSYLFFFSLIFIPFFLSVNTSLETYMNYIYAFLWTNITWVTLMIFLLLANYLFVKLGFKSTSHFYKSLRSKK